MIKKKRQFSLLEVLIAFLLISFSLPLLIAPFLYSAVDQKETLEKLKIEAAAHTSLTSFLVDLHTGKIPQIEPAEQIPLRAEWLNDGQISGSYALKKLKPSRDEALDEKSESVIIELWEATFSLKSPSQKIPIPFSYHFVVVRGT